MSAVGNEVRDFLRVADILFARLQTGKPLSKRESVLLQSYALRVHSLVSILNGYDSLAAVRKITTDLKWEETLVEPIATAPPAHRRRKADKDESQDGSSAKVTK